MTIPQASPKANYLAHQSEIDEAIGRVLASGRYILGPEVAAFEREFAAWLASPHPGMTAGDRLPDSRRPTSDSGLRTPDSGLLHAVGVASGTDALVLALRALDLPPGSEIITVAHTAVATVAAIELAGLVPVLVDIDPRSYTLDPACLAGALTPRTRALIPVHLYGQSADLAPILDFARAHGLRVIEDCAQAHGAVYRGRKAGAYGDLACFSFYPTKNLGAIGDGGLVATADPALAERVRLLQVYGWRERYVSEIPGLNSRLDELQAALLRVKLRYLDAETDRRRALAARYTAGLAGVPANVLGLPQTMGCGRHVYHLYVVRTPRRDELIGWLRARDIGTAIHYPVPVHLQPAYERLGYRGLLPETEQAAREIVSLPMYPELTDDDVDTVVSAIAEWAA